LAFVNISTLIAVRRLYIAGIQFKKRRADEKRTPAPRCKNTPSTMPQLKEAANNM